MQLQTITLGTRSEIPYILFKKSLENLETGIATVQRPSILDTFTKQLAYKKISQTDFLAV